MLAAHKVKEKINNEGLILFFFRISKRAYLKFFRLISTIYWKLFLQQCGKGTRIGIGVYFASPGKVSIGKNVIISDRCHFGTELDTGSMTISTGVQINKNCTVDYTGGVIFGKNTLISEGVKILTHSHGYDPRSTPVGSGLKIGKNVWIGMDAFISENVSHIEDGIIVAAKSVVTRSLSKKNYIYAGIPARPVKKIPGF